MFKIETVSREGRILFTATRKTRQAAERYAAAVAARPTNVAHGVTTRVTNLVRG